MIQSFVSISLNQLVSGSIAQVQVNLTELVQLGSLVLDCQTKS